MPSILMGASTGLFVFVMSYVAALAALEEISLQKMTILTFVLVSLRHNHREEQSVPTE